MQNARYVLQLLNEKFPPPAPKKHSFTLPSADAPPGTVLQLHVWVDGRVVPIVVEGVVVKEDPPLYASHTFNLEAADLDRAPSALVEDIVKLLKG